MVTLTVVTNSLAAEVDGSHRLYVSTVGEDKTPVEPSDRSDPLRMRDHAAVVDAKKVLGLGKVPITFASCSSRNFRTAPDYSVSAGTRAYMIEYSMADGEKGIAAIVHELAHVFQVEQAGGWGALRKLPTLQIELGADFLTGFVFRFASRKLEIDLFQRFVALQALYVENSSEAHGSPAKRNNAFRRAYFGPLHELSSGVSGDPQAANIKFNDDVFSEIKRYEN